MSMFYFVTAIFFYEIITVEGICPSNPCGLNQVCVNNSCICKDTFVPHTNGKDCIDESCSIKDCVLCEDDHCRRCVHFIDREKHTCRDTCSGTADVSYNGTLIGNICQDNTERMDIIIGVVAAVSITILLIFISGLFLCIKARKRRRHIDLHHSPSSTTKIQNSMDYGQLKRLPIFNNIGFEPDTSDQDSENFRSQVDQLREHTDRLHLILYETRMKLRVMADNDPRIPTYKGVIHQLCRVLVLLNKKDPCLSIPGDGLSLIGWAYQMLEDYTDQPDHQSVISCSSLRYSSFPKVCLDAKGLLTAVYALPNDSSKYYTLQPISSKMPGYYSSVPLSHNLDVNSQRNDSNIQNTDETIHNTTSSSAAISYNYRGTSAETTKEFSRTSSHSDYSQQEFTTFTGGVSWPQTDSVSHTSDHTDSITNPDGLPFSPNDATLPIEV